MNKSVAKKVASVLTKRMKELGREGNIHIDNDEWKKTNKKAEIVDIWHQVQKSNRSNRNDYSMYFPFIDAEVTGVDFYLYGRNIVLVNQIKKRLDDLNVKYTTK